jgi:ubiquinone/menaquinone biosynthesis C-methylase UbiE
MDPLWAILTEPDLKHGRWDVEQFFSHCTGVDVAETMIEQATRLNPGSACTFVVNETNDLGRFEDSTFDFVCSALVLQHLPRVEVIRTFIAEFLRVLKPAGLPAFQLPTRMPPRTLRNKLRLRTRAYAAHCAPLASISACSTSG